MSGTVAVVSLSSVAASQPVQIQFPATAVAWAGVGLIVTFTAGASATAIVEISGDGANWGAHDTLNGITASQNGNIAYPILWVRLRLSVRSSGTVTMQVIQARYN